MKPRWENTTLGELFQIKHGYAFKGEFFTNKGDFILLTPGNFKETGGLQHKGEKEKYYAGEIPSDYVLAKGDLLVAMTDLTQNAPILGSPAFVPSSGRYLHNQRLGKIIHPKSDRIAPSFLFYLFNTASVREQIKGSASGATVRHTSPSRIYEVKVRIPCVTIQRKIAAILSAYYDLIESNSRRIAILEEMAQAIYREWFVNFRFPGHEKVKLINSSLGKIPEGWKVVKVEDVVKRLSAGRKYDQKTVVSVGRVPVLDQGKSGIIGYHNDEPGLSASFEQPVIVFANHTCYQRIILFPFSAIQNVLPFAPANDNFRNTYWLHWATKDLVRFNDYKGHWPEFIAKQLVLPHADICELFGANVRPLVLSAHLLGKKNDNLRTTRDLLLPKLIGGQLDVEELEIEIAEPLVEATA